MVKKELLLASTILLLAFAAVSASAYHFGIGGYNPAYGQIPTFKVREGISSEYDKFQDYTTEGFPDLVVNAIHLPDQLPLYTKIEKFAVEIGNKGPGIAEGEITVEISILGKNMPRCKTRIPVGGAFGDPAATFRLGETRLMRETRLRPGDALNVTYYMPFYCQNAIVGDFKVNATVNPIGGGTTGSSVRPKGRLTETDHTNNYFSKLIKVSDEFTGEAEYQMNVKLVPGENFFSIPVSQKFNADAFVKSTGCEIFELSETSLYGSERSIDATKIFLVPRYKDLEPGHIYVADCPSYAVIEFKGADPGPFNIRLGGNTVTAVPSRIGMIGKRLFELTDGCGIIRGAFYSYVPGARTRTGKILPESLGSTTGVVPGLVYLVKCRTTTPGTWDPSEEYYLERSVTGVIPTSSLRTMYRPLGDSQSYYPVKFGAMGSTYRSPSRLGSTRAYSYTYSG